MEAGREPRVRDGVAVYCVRTDPPNSRRNGVVGPWKRFTQKSATSEDDSRIEGDLMASGKGTVLSPAVHTTTPCRTQSRQFGDSQVEHSFEFRDRRIVILGPLCELLDILELPFYSGQLSQVRHWNEVPLRLPAFN